jgi:2-phospho-L-lactate guanylyltransferase
MARDMAPDLVALIPVKSLEHGKSRLSDLLEPSDRMQVTYDSLRRIIYVLRDVPRVQDIIIITRDGQVAEWAGEWDVQSIRERQPGLNEALREARDRSAWSGSILVLPADLVAVCAEDIEAMIDLSRLSERSVVIAPDRRGNGTNALLLKPPHVIDFAFGADSAIRHAQLAEEAGVAPAWYRSESISLDLDLPEDVTLYDGQW